VTFLFNATNLEIYFETDDFGGKLFFETSKFSVQIASENPKFQQLVSVYPSRRGIKG